MTGEATDMRKLLTVAVLILGLGACAEPPRPETSADQRAKCEEALKPSAVTWLESRVQASAVSFQVARNTAEAGESLAKDLSAWQPGRRHESDIGSVRVCSISAPSPGARYRVEYEVSTEALDMVSSPRRGSMVRVSDDVVLTSSWRPPVEDVPDGIGRGEYALYVRCRVPGADPGQLDGAPLKGELEDSLTNESSARVHYTHLLHSARVMVKALGCTNRPVVPAQPPASVK
ncbi:hypothetical protein AB0H29_31260 [Streptomyces thermolilacinus]